MAQVEQNRAPCRKVTRRRWLWLSSLLYDPRYIIGWSLCSAVWAGDVTETLDITLAATGCNCAKGLRMPRLLNDNGSTWTGSNLAKVREDRGMTQGRAAPMFHRGQGSIKRWQRTLNNRTFLETAAMKVTLMDPSPPSSTPTTTTAPKKAPAI